MALQPIQEVRQLLRSRLLSTPGLPAIVAWENRKQDPPAGGRTGWVREALKPQDSARITLGPGAWLKHQGVYFLDVYNPSLYGTKSGDELAGALMDWFGPGRQFTGTVVRVTILRASQAPMIQQQGWWHIPVTVTWTAYSVNTF